MSLLGNFQQHGPADESAADDQPQPLVDGEYKAFGLSNRAVRMLEFRYSGESYGITYAFLRATRFKPGRKDGEQDSLTLYTAAGRIVIRGRHLHELNAGVLMQRVQYVQEFAAEQFTLPGANDPCILKVAPEFKLDE